MTSIEHTGRKAGPVTLHVDTMSADVEVVSDPRATGSWIEISTPDASGPAADTVRNATVRDLGDDIHVKLREGQSVGAGSVVIGANYDVISSGTNVTIVNGRVISGGSASSGPIRVRAILQPGSRLVAKTMSGDVTTKGVASLDASTMSGNIRADEITSPSRLKTMSGDIRVTGTGRPPVNASSMSGDVTGNGVDMTARSMSGRVRQS